MGKKTGRLTCSIAGCRKPDHADDLVWCEEHHLEGLTRDSLCKANSVLKAENKLKEAMEAFLMAEVKEKKYREIAVNIKKGIESC